MFSETKQRTKVIQRNRVRFRNRKKRGDKTVASFWDGLDIRASAAVLCESLAERENVDREVPLLDECPRPNEPQQIILADYNPSVSHQDGKDFQRFLWKFQRSGAVS